VDLLQYRTWAKVGTITNGISNPHGTWVDRAGNLYVANYSGSITEYNVDGSLIFTYTNGAGAPFAVTTDQYGTVYEGDGVFNNIVEFPQGVNSPAISCNILGDLLPGIAVDKHGNVFAANGSNIIEYKHGLLSSHCNGTVLPITFTSLFGIALDTNGNLIACDYGAPAVEIIAPPYTSITGTLGSGWLGPEYVTIDRAGTQAYVTDRTGPGIFILDILTYPAGSIVAQVTSANGIGSPTSAVDSRNYVP
jgi:hypothetical protein